MGFYNLLGSSNIINQESLPGSNLIINQEYSGYYFTNKALYWSTSITFSTGVYGIYFSNFSNSSANISINHPTKIVNNKIYSVNSKSKLEQYIDGDAQNINITIDNTNLSWSTVDISSNIQLNAIAHGNGIFVVVGDNGSVSSSTDGTIWTSRSIGFTTNIETITYGNGIFVAGTAIGGIRTSTDAITWTARTGPFAVSFTRIKYVNNIFLGSYLGTGFTRSTDGVTWTSTNILYTSGMHAMAYGAGVYAACGGIASATAGIFRSSTDGITWTSRASISGFVPRDLEFINNEFYAVGFSTGGIIAKSTNAITWTTVVNTSFAFSSSLAFIKYLETEKMFIAGGSGRSVISSTDGIRWIESFSYTTRSEGIGYNDGNLVVVGFAYGAKSDIRNNTTYVQISKIEEV